MVKRKVHINQSNCPLACALDLIGDHWTLLIIRDLMFLGKHEYKDMLESEEKISSNILCDRLKKLEGAELIASISHPDSNKRKLFYLTQKGKDLIHIMIETARWSQKHLENTVVISTESNEMLLNEPDLMVEKTLKTLSEWENAHHIVI